MTINELVIKSDEELTDNQREFLKVHQEILMTGAVIGNSLL